MALTAAELHGIYTQAMIAKYQEQTPDYQFFSSFFTKTSVTSKEVSIAVRRDQLSIAAQVQRGTGPNKNKWSKESMKAFVPPYFAESFTDNELDRYHNSLFTGNNDPQVVGYMASDVAFKYLELRKKIEQYKELMASQVFETGVVSIDYGTDVDYGRKAASLKDNSASPWSTITTDIEAQLIAGCDFVRTVGNTSVSEFNATMRSAEWISLKKSNYFTNNANFQNVLLVDIKMPQVNSNGGVFMGRITAGSYIINIWVYDGVYKAQTTKTVTNFWPLKKVLLTPVAGTEFIMAHAGVPAIIRDKSNAEFKEYIGLLAADYYQNNYIDQASKTHIFELLSAAIPVPVTIDQMYTMTVEA